VVSNSISSLVLGTAQLGLDYGIANQSGRPDQSTAIDIVRTAWENGIQEFDTAQAYGDSEKVLGNALQSLGISKEVRVITKINPSIDLQNRDAVLKSIEDSLRKLRVDRLSVLMLHHEESLRFWDRGIANCLEYCVTEGIIKQKGISIYTPDKAIEALNTEGIDAVQIPANLFDRRFKDVGVLELASELGKEVYIRSIYLQGLLLLTAPELPRNMDFAKPIINKLTELCMMLKVSRQELAITHIRKNYSNSKVVIGVDNAKQLIMNCRYWEKNLSEEYASAVMEGFSSVDEKILNPSHWRIERNKDI
jgi:aryl-alcohol dehydrogenase-like predicted oxidoreductase